MVSVETGHREAHHRTGVWSVASDVVRIIRADLARPKARPGQASRSTNAFPYKVQCVSWEPLDRSVGPDLPRETTDQTRPCARHARPGTYRRTHEQWQPETPPGAPPLGKEHHVREARDLKRDQDQTRRPFARACWLRAHRPNAP